MYDLSFEYMLLPDEEVMEHWKRFAPCYRRCANEIFSHLCNMKHPRAFLISYILKHINDNDKRAIKKALEIDFKYYSIQMGTRWKRRLKASKGKKKRMSETSNPDEMPTEKEKNGAKKLNRDEMTVTSFARYIFTDRQYVIRDKYPQKAKNYYVSLSDDEIMDGFKYFLSHLPDKIKDLELNFNEQEYFKQDNPKKEPILKEKIRSYSYSPLSKDFILYCYKYFYEIPSLKQSNNIHSNGNITSFLNFDREISAFKLNSSSVDKSDDLFLLYEIEQHFMPYCMAVIHEKMPGISDKLLADIKALAAPMTRLILVKILAKYVEVNKGRKIMIPDDNYPIKHKYDLYQPGQIIEINIDRITDIMGSFVSSFPGIFYYQYSGSVQNVMKTKTDRFKKEINKEVQFAFGGLHKRLANEKYQEFYENEYYKIMNTFDQFYSCHRTDLNYLHEIEKKLIVNSPTS